MADLLNIIEDSLKAILDNASTGATVFTGQTEGDQVRPCVIVYASSGVEEVPFSGAYRVSVSVKVLSNANDTTKADHTTLVQTVQDVIHVDDIHTQLSAYDGLFVYAIPYNKQKLESVDGDSFMSELHFDMFCCEAEIA